MYSCPNKSERKFLSWKFLFITAISSHYWLSASVTVWRLLEPIIDHSDRMIMVFTQCNARYNLGNGKKKAVIHAAVLASDVWWVRYVCLYWAYASIQVEKENRSTEVRLRDSATKTLAGKTRSSWPLHVTVDYISCSYFSRHYSSCHLRKFSRDFTLFDYDLC